MASAFRVYRAISGLVVSKSLKPANTLVFEQYGQPDFILVLLEIVAFQVCPRLHFHLKLLLLFAKIVVGSQPSASAARSGLVVARSLNPTRSLLFEQIGLNKRESKDMVDAFFSLVSASLVNGQDVKITGFGNFQIRTKAPRPGRNPRTGEAIPIDARRVVTFHASQKLKEQIQDDGGVFEMPRLLR